VPLTWICATCVASCRLKCLAMMTPPSPTRKPSSHPSISRPWLSMIQSACLAKVRYYHCRLWEVEISFLRENHAIKSKVQITADNEQGNLIAVGSPIVLQRRGSVYGANVPMITGKKDLQDYISTCSLYCSNENEDTYLKMKTLIHY